MTPNIRDKRFAVGDVIESTITGMVRKIVRKVGEHYVIEHVDHKGAVVHDYVTLDRLQAYWSVIGHGEDEQEQG